MSGKLTIDWGQKRPDAQAIDASWQETKIIASNSLDTRLVAVRNGLSSTRHNGGAKVAQFRLEAAPAVMWFLARNRLTEAGLFRRFFTRPEVARELDLSPAPDAADDLGFTLDAPFVAMGWLAHNISIGGAYEKFGGSDGEVLALMQDFAQAATAGRYAGTQAYLSWKPWSAWFKDIAWDMSFFWFDPWSETATVVLATDTD